MADYSMEDLVCLHLQQVEDVDADPVPDAASTPGIADAMELGSETVADRVDLLSALSALPQKGLLEQRTAPVEERGDERNVYALTDEGRRHARRRRDQLQGAEIVVRRAADETRVRLSAIGEYLEADVADPVVAALARAEGDVLVVEDEYSPETTDRFVDRESELATLEARFEQALSGEPQTVFVSGEPGVGKTTLVRKFEETVVGNDGLFLYGRCHSDVTEPYQPFVTAFADLPDDTRTQLTATLTEASTVEADDRETLEAQRRTQFYEVGTELAAVAGERPVVVFIDDLQWVDRSTVLLFASLARRVSSGPLLFLGACRPETATGDWPLAETLDELEEETYEWLDVDRLDREWTGQLVRQTVESLHVPENFVDALYERTDGNPLFVTESVTHMLERHDIDPDLGVYPESPAELSVPEEVERTVVSRFDVLDAETRSLLELGSVIGDTVPRDVLETASDLDEAAFLDYAGILVGSGVWRYEDGQQTVYFESGVVRETIQDRIDETRWRRLHRTVADAYRSLGEDEHAAAVAHHYREGGELATALEYYRRAGEQARDIYAHEAAIDAAERAVELARELDDEETLLATLEDLGDIYSVLDEYDDAMSCFEFVLERSEDPARRQRMFRKQARLDDSMGEYERFFERVEDGLALADAPDCSPVETARLHSLRGRGLTIQGAPDEALSCHDRALAVLDDVDDVEGERARVLNGIGNAHQAKGEIDRATELYERLVAIRRGGDDRQALAGVLTNYANALDRAGEYERAVEVYEEARDISEDIGDREGVMTVLNNLGITYQYLDADERAIACFEEGLDIARTTENRRTLALLYVNLGYAYGNRGEFDTAIEYATDALELGESMDATQTIVCAHEIQAFAHRYRGELDAGIDIATAGLEIAREAGERNRIAGSLSVLGDLRLERGATEAAIEAFEAGIDQSLAFGNAQKATVNRAGLVRALAAAGDTGRAREHVGELEAVTEMLEETVPALATFYRTVGEYDFARAHIERGRKELRGTMQPLTACELLLEEARIHTGEGDVERARECATSARERATDHSATLLVETAERVLADLDTTTDVD